MSLIIQGIATGFAIAAPVGASSWYCNFQFWFLFSSKIIKVGSLHDKKKLSIFVFWIVHKYSSLNHSLKHNRHLLPTSKAGYHF